MVRDHRASEAKPFRGGDVTTVMGRAHLDLRQATIEPGQTAVIDVFGLMGAVVVEVPRDWVVDVESVNVFGGVRDQRSPVQPASGDEAPAVPEEALERPDPPAVSGQPPRLVLRGFVMMGRLTLRS
jgi:hypothetical protein